MCRLSCTSTKVITQIWDIEKMLIELGIESLKFEELVKMPSGQTSKTFKLPRREVEILITGHSTVNNYLLIYKVINPTWLTVHPCKS